MKHYSSDSKKFIKNVVSLAVSALLLAAATFAWFSTSTETGTPRFAGSANSPARLRYEHMTADDSFLDFDLDEHDALTTDLAIRTRVVSNGTVTTDDYDAVEEYLDDTLPADWVAGSSDATWNLSNLHPGEYGAYRICYTSAGETRALKFSDITYTVPGNNSSVLEAAMKSVYVYVYTKITALDNSETIDVPNDAPYTLYDLLYQQQSGSYRTDADVLSSVYAETGCAVEIYYVIGMPANTSRTLHETLRTVGAEIEIDEIDAEVAS